MIVLTCEAVVLVDERWPKMADVHSRLVNRYMAVAKADCYAVVTDSGCWQWKAMVVVHDDCDRGDW